MSVPIHVNLYGMLLESSPKSRVLVEFLMPRSNIKFVLRFPSLFPRVVLLIAFSISLSDILKVPHCDPFARAAE